MKTKTRPAQRIELSVDLDEVVSEVLEKALTTDLIAELEERDELPAPKGVGEFTTWIEQRHTFDHGGPLATCRDDVCDAWWRLVVESR